MIAYYQIYTNINQWGGVDIVEGRIMGNKPRNWSKRWAEADLKWLKSNYRRFTYKEIANKLGRTELAINGIVIKKGWAKAKPKWQANQTNMLKKLWGKISIGELEKRIGRSKDSIFCKARRSKLRKKLEGN